MSDDEQQVEQEEEEQEPEPAAPKSTESHMPEAFHDAVAKPQADCCPRCGDRAYHAESISMEGYKFHKRCFSCKDCKKKLDSTNANSHEGKTLIRTI
jgi:hypothetical protein